MRGESAFPAGDRAEERDTISMGLVRIPGVWIDVPERHDHTLISDPVRWLRHPKLLEVREASITRLFECSPLANSSSLPRAAIGQVHGPANFVPSSVRAVPCLPHQACRRGCSRACALQLGSFRLLGVSSFA